MTLLVNEALLPRIPLMEIIDLVMGTGMPVPAFARPFAKNLMPAMPVPEDLQKGQMPVCPCPQKSPKYRACHRALGAVHKLREQQGGRGVFHKCSCLFTWGERGVFAKVHVAFLD